MSAAIRRTAWAAVVLCALLPGRASAQVVGTTVRSIWTSSIGYLGIDNLRCNCTFRSEPDGSGRLFMFRSEPVVLGIVPGTPAAAFLRGGDTIVEIDGVSLLTSDGAQRFASIRPNQQLTLTVRRGGKLLRFALTAAEIDPNDPRAMGRFTPRAAGDYATTWYELPPTPPQPAVPPGAVAAPAPRAPSRATPAPHAAPGVGVPEGWLVPPRAAAPARPVAPTQPPSTPAPKVGVMGGSWATTVPYGSASPRGWFGFSIRCSGCGWSAAPGESPVWESDTAPELSMVSPNSPAGRAGLRAGDKLTHIDGVSILAPEGARRFGRVLPGQKVKLTVLRNGRAITRELTLGTRPEARAAIAATTPRAALPPATRRELRYSGKLDDISVEVWSAGGPTVERVGDTMIITVGASVIRLKVDPKTK